MDGVHHLLRSLIDVFIADLFQLLHIVASLLFIKLVDLNKASNAANDLVPLLKRILILLFILISLSLSY